LKREYNYNKDITKLDKYNKCFFSSDLSSEKKVFSYTNNIKVLMKELELAGINNDASEVYDEYENIYIDFTDNKKAKNFIKKLNEYIKHCEKIENTISTKLNTIEEFENNEIINHRIKSFSSEFQK